MVDFVVVAWTGTSGISSYFTLHHSPLDLVADIIMPR